MYSPISVNNTIFSSGQFFRGRIELNYIIRYSLCIFWVDQIFKHNSAREEIGLRITCYLFYIPKEKVLGIICITLKCYPLEILNKRSIFFLIFFLGVFVSDVYSRNLKKEDPRSAVIDEAAGQSLALFLLNPEWFLCLASFILFRFFDIVKPFPIKQVEVLPKGFGIMLDDVVAALYAGILINFYLLLK